MADLDRALLEPRPPWRRTLAVAGGTVVAVSVNAVAVAWLLRPLVAAPGVVVVQPPCSPARDADVCAPEAEAASQGVLHEPEATPAGEPVPPGSEPAEPPPVALAPPVIAPLALAPRACPPPRTDAPRVNVPEIEERVERIIAAPSNAGWLAAWNREHVFVSTDAGAHFTRVLDGPGAVTDVGFDCFGTVIVVREERLGLRVGADERWSAIEGLEVMDLAEDPADRSGHAAIVSGGPEIVLVGRIGDWWNPRVARSADLGVHWRFHDLEADWESPIIRGRQREDGAIAFTLPATDCAGDSEGVVEIRGGKVESGFGSSWPELGHAPDLEPWPKGLPADAVWAGADVLQSGDALYRLRGTRARKLPVLAEDGDQPYVLDAASRVWTIRCGQLVLAGKHPSGITCPDEE